MQQEHEELKAELRRVGKRKIDAVEFVRDIRAGYSDLEMMEKYGLSRDELKAALRKISRERDNLAGQLVKDIKGGMGDLELMTKYKLTSRGLQLAYARLVKLKYIDRSVVKDRLPTFGTAITLEDMRKLPRNFPAIEIAIYEDGKPDNLGQIIDVSESGIGARGIQAVLNEKMGLIIPPDEFGEFAAVRFEGKCKWVDESGNGQRRSGFEITDISKGCLEELRFLIKAQTI